MAETRLVLGGHHLVQGTSILSLDWHIVSSSPALVGHFSYLGLIKGGGNEDFYTMLSHKKRNAIVISSLRAVLSLLKLQPSGYNFLWTHPSIVTGLTSKVTLNKLF